MLGKASNIMKGFIALGVVFCMGILSVLSFALANYTASNQATRNNQFYMDQAFASAHAAFEYAMRQIKVEGNPSSIPVRHFADTTLAPIRAGTKVSVATSKSIASNSFSITDPTPPGQANCLLVDVSGANWSNSHKTLTGITFARDPSCSSTLTITSMKISWTPVGSQDIILIQINSIIGFEYYNPISNLGSGSTFPFTVPYSISSNTTRYLRQIIWDSSTSNTITTLTFIMSDGSTKNAVINY
jgi:hypothetical protein